jgi:hypothetical protein
MGVWLCERYWPGVTQATAAAAVAAVRRAVDAMRDEGSAIRVISSSLVVEDEALFTYFEAGTTELVAEANRRAELPVDRINACVDVPGGEA